MSKLAIIHTTAATIDPLKALALKCIPGVAIVNFVDDSILPQLLENGGDVSQVEPRVLQYARYAQEVGANIVLEACSSIGEVVPKIRQILSIPVVRIDEPMVEFAVAQGRRIGVAATLPTTLKPTTRLLEATASARGKLVDIQPLLIEGAYAKLLSGDPQGHDQALVESLSNLVSSCDWVVLAQASMARVLPRLSAGVRDRFLTSPRLAIQQVQQVLKEQHG